MSQHLSPKHQAAKPGTVRRTARWAGTIALVAVMLACAAWMIPALFGYSRYVITGGSMTGSYDKGSVVFEKKVAVEDLKVGDVITYLPPADSGVPNLVTHRILKMEPAQGGGTLFTTKGDANPQPDPWHFLLLDAQQPVVQYGVPHAGWIFMALADREVRMLVIGLPAALIALGALGQLVGAIRGRRYWEMPAPALPAEALAEPAIPDFEPAPAHLVPSQRTRHNGLPETIRVPDRELV
ncbi:MAG: signal peptidase I [Caulobacteraceae bacterium]|nr:MAG: signal peptidase I [Caulobacteraceae bacterium]